jgi:4-amino-4-deoxy-L-arabinose transferase-like glycosyltransferase
MGTRFPGWLVVILLAAIVLRLGLFVAQRDRSIELDETTYDQIARNLVAGHGFSKGDTDADRAPTAERAPSYVLVVAACYRLVGHRPRAVFLLQILFDAISVLLVYWLARRWFPSPRVALVAAAMFGAYPPFSIMATQLLTESFATLALLAAVACFASALERPRWPALVGSGIALAAAALAKSQLAPVVGVLAVASIRSLGLGGTLRRALAVGLVMALVMSPWIVRNARVFHAFIPGVSTGGLALWLGSGAYDGRTIGGLDSPLVPDSLRSALLPMSEVERNRWGSAEALRVIASHPARYAWLSLRKCFQLWLNLGYDARPSRASLAIATLNLWLWGLAVIGLARGGADAWGARFIAWLAAFWTVVHVPFSTQVRYSYPFVALLVIFSAAGLVTLAMRTGWAREKEPAVGA